MSALDALRLVVPASLRPTMRSAFTRLRFGGWQRRCNVCDSALRGFTAHGIPPEPDFLCPVCRSKPPHRLASLYFAQNPGLLREGGLLVHIAPELGLGRRLRKLAASRDMRYRAGSISGSGDSHLDLLHLPFEDASVELMYCCHVLNCMADDRAAMREVRRVLAPGGVALLQVPAFEPGPATIETHGEVDRLATFGDGGIHRRYTNSDYVERLEAAGFSVEEFRASAFDARTIERLQLKAEVLHVCRGR